MGGEGIGTLGVNSDKEHPHIPIGRRKMVPDESNEEQRKYEICWETQKKADCKLQGSYLMESTNIH